MMGKKMKPQTCYASLAIYSDRECLEKVGRVLDRKPTSYREKSGVFSWVYSTKDEKYCENLEQHLSLLRCRFDDVTENLVRLSHEGFDIRLWIYFVVEDINSSVLLEEKFIAWLASFRADVYVDIWAR